MLEAIHYLRSGLLKQLIERNQLVDKLITYFIMHIINFLTVVWKLVCACPWGSIFRECKN